LDSKAISDIQMDNCRGHDLPRLRGVMYGPRVKEQDFKDLAAWGANHIRFQARWVPANKAKDLAQDLKKYRAWIKSFLPKIDLAVKLCRKYKIKMLLDLHTVPGGRGKHNINRIFDNQKYTDEFIKTWQLLAKRYKKDGDVIYAYDLFNEPLESTNGKYRWIDIACAAIKAIRKIDPGKPIVYEPGPFGGCQGFDIMQPLPFKRIIYSFHMYNPHKFTHQLKPPATISYPGVVNGIKWDKKRLRESMLPAIDFSRKYNVHIYIGEFSAIRWAPNKSAYRYLQDVIELFEELKWDWAYHAYREWQGWSVEHDTNWENKKPVTTPTDRYKLLGRWFKKNEVKR
jgi:aryl-phospho-beta-D-glucosidase BglC (GH1 family)